MSLLFCSVPFFLFFFVLRGDKIVKRIYRRGEERQKTFLFWGGVDFRYTKWKKYFIKK